MTLEELKKEAGKYGYRLVPKKKKLERLLPCLCGCKRREHWYGSGNRKYILFCQRCGIEASGRTEREAYKAWNDMVRGANDTERGADRD